MSFIESLLVDQNLQTPDLFWMCLIIFLGSFIQSAIGFGYGLFTCPLLMAIGFPLPYAVSILSACASIQSLTGTIHMRKHIPWSDLKLIIPLRFVGLFAGIASLHWLLELDVESIKQVVGFVLIAMIVLQYLCKVRVREKVHVFWSTLSFLSSGYLAALFGMGGPAILIWLLAHDWSKEKIKAFLFTSFVFFTPVQLAVLIYFVDTGILKWVAMAILLTPIIVLGARLGLALGEKIPKNLFRAIVYVILLMISLRLIFPF